MASNKLYRSFIILQEDERGHSVSNDKPLSGYAKIEAKGEKCKIAFYAQNLKSADEKCHMALVCNKKDGNFILDLGLMNINSQGKAEASLECSTNNIGNLDVSYDKIIGAVIYKEIGGKAIYLMCGFLNGQQPKDNWKLYNILSKHGLIKKPKNDSSKKSEEEHKHNTSNEVKEENSGQRSVEQDIEIEEVNTVSNNEIRVEEVSSVSDENLKSVESDSLEVDDDTEDANENGSRFDEYENLIEARISGGNYEREADESYSEVESQRSVETIEIKLDDSSIEDDIVDEETARENIRDVISHIEKVQGVQQSTFDFQGVTGVQGTVGVTGVQKSQGITGVQQGQGTIGVQGVTGTQQGLGTVGIQGTGAGMQQGQVTGTQGVTGTQQAQGITGVQGVTGIKQDASVTGIHGKVEVPYQGTMHAGYKAWQGETRQDRSVQDEEVRENIFEEIKDIEEEFELTGSTAEFFSSVVNDFEYTRGFAKDVKKCKWYKVKVDNFDILCDMSNYNKYTVAYYPMINYYPYICRKGYFMIGFKYDENGVVKYVTYAIPGYKDKKDQPYGGKTGFVTWCPEFKNSLDGHWIMFYDFQSSKVLVPIV